MANLTSARLWDRLMHGGISDCNNGSGQQDHHGINGAVQAFIRRRSTGGQETGRKKQVHFHFRQRSYDGVVGKNCSFGDGGARYVFRKGSSSAVELIPAPESPQGLSGYETRCGPPQNYHHHFVYGQTPFPNSGVLHEEVESPYPEGSLPITHSLPGNINSILSEESLQTELPDGDQIDGLFQKLPNKKYGEKTSSKIRNAKQKKSKQKDGHAHRSKSLTQIDCLDTNSHMVRRSHELDSARSEPETSPCSPSSAPFGGILSVPPVLPQVLQSSVHGNLQSGSGLDDQPGAQGRPGYKPPQKVQMPSQELFSVTFDQWDDPGHYELLPAVKGVLLRDALQGLLDRRSIDVNNINVYLDSSNTPLSLQFETFRLGGNHLHVRARDSADVAFITRANSTGSSVSGVGSVSRVTAIRSNSSSSAFHPRDERTKKMSAGSQRARRNALMLSDELVPDGNPVAAFGQIAAVEGAWKSGQKRPPLARKTGIFSNPSKTEREKMELLSDLLNLYSKLGIPELPSLLTFAHSAEPTQPQEDPYYLEDHWSQFVNNAQELSKRSRNQQDAIWELLHTEVFYIRRLIVISDLFLACLCNLQNECLLNEIDTERMFSNISEIYSSNQRFWLDHLLPMLNASRTNHEPLNPIMMKEGFLKFDEIFNAYIRYCIEHQSCLQYVKDRHKDNELFKTFVAWCETQKDCDRLRLVDLLVKPVQRLTKYSLLLKAVHKKTDSDDLKSALLEMNEGVENFVLSVDATMRQRSEQERLSSIIGRIESYDAIDTNNDELDRALKEHCVLDLTCPMPGCGNQQSRQLLIEGSGLKLRDTSSSKVDVHCFLFTDMLLICKAKKGDRVRVIRQPYVVDRLVMAELRDGSGILVIYLNEYRVATAAFILYTADTKIWIENIRKAQELYGDAKAAAASERQSLGFLKSNDEDEDYEFPSTALMVTRSPRSSSHSSLVHSHSGSVDMSDPVSGASGGMCGPPLNTSPVSQHNTPHGKAVSIELGDFRNASLNTEDVELARMRSSSVETRVCVTLTSPRPERRAFLLRGGTNSPTSPGPPTAVMVPTLVPTNNTLSLSVPCFGEVYDNREDNVPVIQLPVIIPPAKNLSSSSRLVTLSPRSLQRVAPINSKPPLVKTKNISGLVTHSAPPSEGPSPVHSLEGDPLGGATVGVVSSFREANNPGFNFSLESEEEISRRLNGKRAGRNERRYHTADSIENMKKEKDTSIHKRLSWNCGQQHNQQGHMYTATSSGAGSLVSCGPSERLLRNKQANKCLSSESIYSSSGVSSTGSMHQSTDYDSSDILEEPTSFVESEGTADMQLMDGDVGESSTDDQVGVRSTRSTLSDPGSVVDALSMGLHQRQVSDPCPSSSSVRSQQPPPVPPRTLPVSKAGSGSNIKIDVSEVKEGISSVQITVNGGAVQNSKPSKDDLRRLKQLLLNSCSVEASEV